MKIALIAVLSAALVAVGAQALPPAVDRAATTDEGLVEPAVTEDSTTAGNGAAGGDVSGPCDEAEHADEPRCDGPRSAEDERVAADAGEPARTPAAEAGDDGGPRVDNSGPGSLNSGPGSVSSGSGGGSSGPGGDDDSDGGDRSGHSGGGSDSGSGSDGGDDD